MYLKFTNKKFKEQYGIWKIDENYINMRCVYYGTLGPFKGEWRSLDNYIGNIEHTSDILTDDEAFIELI